MVRVRILLTWNTYLLFNFDVVKFDGEDDEGDEGEVEIIVFF